jgi:uncharacterized protein (TIGR00299 family) protein
VTGGPPRDPAAGGAAADGRAVAWFHCFAGIAGDMALGALLDAGADLDEVTGLLRRLPVGGWDLQVERVRRGGIACTRAVVVAGADPTGRTASDVDRAVRAAALPARVERRALATFDALARAEGALHGVAPGEVHFHEVGGHDAIVEIVGIAAALEVLGVDEVSCSSVALGTGTVSAAHGNLPNPAPAVLRLLEGVPTYGRPLPVELTTPTGAALVRALGRGFGAMPAMTVRASGYGAGAAELEHLANATQVVVGAADAPASGPGQEVALVAANLDDATGEQLADAVAALLEAGAHDAWVAAVTMKKGRPGHTLQALCDPSLAEPLAATMRRTTGTFGVRVTRAARWVEARETATVVVTGETVRMKVGAGRAKPEHDDVRRVAAVTGLSAREVGSRAEEAWRRHLG